jgi:predicted amidohydrolase YtcJ
MNQPILLHNAKIWTHAGEKSWMIIQDGKILSIGGDSEITDWTGRSIDVNGQIILPGLHDSHIHVYSLGRYQGRLRLGKCGSISEMQNKLSDYIKEKPANTDWVIGHNWDQDYMEDDRYPTKQDIDVIISDRPVVLFRACNHIGVLNSKALEILQLDESSIDPDGGKIDRDHQGQLTGILRENALNFVTPLIKIHDFQKRKELFKKGIQECLELGLTAVHTNDADAWRIYSILEAEQQLPIRVFLTIYHRELGSSDIPPLNNSDGLFKVKRVKLLADGSLGAHTAALKEAYSDTNTKGITIYNQNELNKKVRAAHELGYQLEVHAIGDLAAEQVLTSFQEAGIQKNDRPVLTHCQVLSSEILELMHKIGVIANIQPIFVETDSLWVEKRLGETDRLEFAYAWKTILEYGIPASGGSDAPIETANPLLGIYSAMFRENKLGIPWMPEQCLSFTESLDLYTQGAAYAVEEEHHLGKLAPGYYADFVILDQDVINHPRLLKKAKPVQVWVNGERRL